MLNGKKSKANIILDHLKWKNKINNPKKYFEVKLNKLSKIPLFKGKKQEFSILLTNNKRMKILNYKFRKIKKPTDVLSFTAENFRKKNTYIGDIAISFDIIKKRSKPKTNAMTKKSTNPLFPKRLGKTPVDQ